MKDSNLTIYRRNIVDQTIRNNIKIHQKRRKVATGQGRNNATVY